jgi:hypothetical protein
MSRGRLSLVVGIYLRILSVLSVLCGQILAAESAEISCREFRFFYLTTGELASAAFESSAWILPSSSA